ncbi:MAG: hypothetical protein AB1544_07020 [Pseudomonadota bacterium]|jgi:hypothetical protein
MAQQINLYDPALLRKRDWFALSNLVLGAGIAALLVATTGMLVRSGLPELQAQTTTGEAQLKAMRDQVLVLGQRVAERKADPRIEQELAAARQLAAARGGVLQALRQRLASGEPSFADYLRGLARQSMTGLWITGFAWDAASDGLEIRGRTTDPALLPEYIGRLNREPAFRGQAFAALTVAEGKPDTVAGSAAPIPSAQKALFHEFTLVPVKRGAATGAAAGRQG